MKDYQLAQEIFDIQIAELNKIRDRIDDNFAAALKIMEDIDGKIVVTGIGKSGIIAQKIAATMTSIGSPAIFIHASEALHGDLGFIGKDDVVIVISNTGTTAEIIALLPHIETIGAKIIAMTGDLNSPLAKAADVVLDIGVEKESCEIGLVPTSSTTVTLVMGDALAVLLAKKKGFKEDHFRSIHPGGGIGKRLKLHVTDIMHPIQEIPTLSLDSSFSDIVDCMNLKKQFIGALPLVDAENKLIGLISWGDLRLALKNKEKVFQLKAKDIANPHPVTIQQTDLAYNALKLMENRERPLTVLPVVNEQGQLVGMVRIQDIIGKI